MFANDLFQALVCTQAVHLLFTRRIQEKVVLPWLFYKGGANKYQQFLRCTTPYTFSISALKLKLGRAHSLHEIKNTNKINHYKRFVLTTGKNCNNKQFLLFPVKPFI